jgi:hypothetical protein
MSTMEPDEGSQAEGPRWERGDAAGTPEGPRWEGAEGEEATDSDDADADADGSTDS